MVLTSRGGVKILFKMHPEEKESAFSSDSKRSLVALGTGIGVKEVGDERQNLQISRANVALPS